MTQQQPGIDGLRTRSDLESFVKQLVQKPGFVPAPSLVGVATSPGRFVRNDDEDNQRTVRGIINTAGSIVAGVGFSVTRNGVGDITVTFTTAFSDVPTVIPAAQGAGFFAANNAVSPTTTTARFFRHAGGAANDGVLHFIAMGPA